MPDKDIEKPEKKIVIPGDYIGSEEEFIPGKNTTTEKEGIISLVNGELEKYGRMMEVITKRKTFVEITEGMGAYCVVEQTSSTKAFLRCIPIVKDNERSYPNFEAVLPISSIRRGYVESIASEVRIGDIIKAKVTKKEKSLIDVSIMDHDCGVVKAFCSRCRTNMIIKDDKLICNHCERTETRKLINSNENNERRREQRTGEYYAGKHNRF